MNHLYLISQSKNRGYDTYDSAVVVAPSAYEAQRTHPGGDKFWDEKLQAWCYDNWKSSPIRGDSYWTTPEHVEVTYLGELGTDSIGDARVVCASFNAG